MRKILRVIDAISEGIGSAGRWVVVALIAITFWDVLLRYVFGHATMWAFETGMMMGSAIIALGWAYCQKHDAHIRVDVIYVRLSERAKAVINVLGTVIFFIPLFIFLIIHATEWMVESWVFGEVSDKGYWYPPMGPIRTLFVVALLALFFQGIASLIRDVYFIGKKKPL